MTGARHDPSTSVIFDPGYELHTDVALVRRVVEAIGGGEPALSTLAPREAESVAVSILEVVDDYLYRDLDEDEPVTKRDTERFAPCHPQIELADLGFEVDEGMETLIRACWHRGITTMMSCIGEDTSRIWLGGRAAVERWEALTGRPVTWDGVFQS